MEVPRTESDRLDRLGVVNEDMNESWDDKKKKKFKFWKRKDALADKDVKAFLDKMEKAGLIQSFGCVLLVDERSLRIKALSENVPELLCGKAATITRPFQFLKDRISRSISKHNKSRAQFQRASSSVIRAQAVAMASSHSENAAAVISELALANGSEESTEKNSKQRKIGVGDDARILFTRASVIALEAATNSGDMALMNPVLLQSQATNLPFYGILHQHPGGGILMDLEPIQPSDPIINGAGALQSHRLAAKAVMRIQSLQPGNQKLLFQAVAEEIRSLTGYDRVMVYKFHEDEHGEVVAEDRAKHMESYLGLHYPSSDIPKASRVLFMRNRCRMIVDSKQSPVRVVQDKGWLGLQNSVSLGGSTMRAVHGCHTQYMANMGVAASLTLSLVMREKNGSLLVSMPASAGISSRILRSVSSRSHTTSVRSNDTSALSHATSLRSNENSTSSCAESDGSMDESGEEKDAVLWGMVVCHHSSPKYVSYPVRSACEFLMQVFGLQLTREIEAEAQKQEHHILRLQTLLCEVMMRPDPVQSLMSAKPGIMDLIKCTGAALIGGDTFQGAGVCPDRDQLRDLISWMRRAHPESTGFTIDSLVASGYPNAAAISDKVCGLAGAKLSEDQYLFWFREHVEKEIHWGGAKQDKSGKVKDSFKKQTPRASFQAFLEIVKGRSQPWSDTDIDAIHSLQLILRDALALTLTRGTRLQEHQQRSLQQDQEYQRLYSATFDQLVHFIEAASAPIMAVDLQGCVTGWNRRAAELTGLSFEQACGKSLVEDLLDVKTRESAQSALELAIAGTETHNIHLRLLVWGEAAAALDPSADGAVIVVANTFVSKDPEGNPQGVCFLGQDVTQEKVAQDQFLRVKGDYSSIIHSRSSIIPPIFGCDEMGRCIEWNHSMEDLSGWRRGEAVRRMLIGEVFGGLCALESHMTKTKLMIAISKALAGHVTDKMPFAFLDRERSLVDVMLSVYPRRSSDGLSIAGAFCFLHVAGLELKQSVRLQRATEALAAQKSRDVAYLRQEVIGPLNGLQWSLSELARSVTDNGHMSRDRGKQQAWLKTQTSLLRQIQASLEDIDVGLLEQGYMEMRASTFTMESVMNAVVAQATVAGSTVDAKVTSDIPGDVRNLPLSGDAERLQQVLSGFAVIVARFTPVSGLIKIDVMNRGQRLLRAATTAAEIEIKISHTGAGVPEELISQMMEDNRPNRSQEGLVLYLERLILRCMDRGEVRYLRDGVRPAFVVNVNMALASTARRMSMIPSL